MSECNRRERERSGGKVSECNRRKRERSGGKVSECNMRENVEWREDDCEVVKRKWSGVEGE